MAESGILSKNVAMPTRELDPEKETAIGQLPGIMAKDNPLQQQAVTKSQQAWNARGLLPSSMAIQAGEEAAIGAAMPLATEAAGAYRGQALANQGIQGQSALNLQQIQAGKESGAENFGYTTQLNQQQIEAQKEAQKAGFGYTTQLNQQQIEANKATQQQQIEAQKALQESSFLNQQTMAKLDQENKIAFAQLEKDHQLTLQNNTSATNMYNQTMQSISQIASNPELSPEQQKAGVNYQYQLLEQGLKLIGSIPKDSIDFAGTAQGKTSITAPTINTTGGMAPGQTPPMSGDLSPSDLAPGAYVGQIKEVGLNSGIPNTGTKVRWTTEGWVRV